MKVSPVMMVAMVATAAAKVELMIGPRVFL
jgi:hypothetical protein